VRASRIVALSVLIVAVGALSVVVLGRPQSTENDDPPPREARQRSAAVRTATRFLVGLDAPTLLDEDARRSFVSRWASRDAEPQLQRLYDAEAERIAVLLDGYSRAAPLGYRVEHLRAGSADVAIWAVSLASVGDIPAAVGWRTLVVGLVREGGSWRISTVTDAPGPSPDSPPARFRLAAERFREYRIAP